MYIHPLKLLLLMPLSNIPNGTHPELRSVDGGYGPAESIGDAGSEANLDFQMAYGLIYPQQAVVFQVDDEVYQYNQTTNNSPYRGFFNSRPRSFITYKNPLLTPIV
jgi:tripeptidyl-peptidase-1